MLIEWSETLENCFIIITCDAGSKKNIQKDFFQIQLAALTDLKKITSWTIH